MSLLNNYSQIMIEDIKTLPVEEIQTKYYQISGNDLECFEYIDKNKIVIEEI